MQKQFTSTVYVLNGSSVLMHEHKKHEKWLPPGGHVEENELPTDAAIREVKEETNLSIELISEENIWVDFPHAKSIARPYLCLLENIPAYKDNQPHQHIDFIYLAKPIDNKEPSPDFFWLSIRDIEELFLQEKVFPDTVLIARKLLSSERTSALT